MVPLVLVVERVGGRSRNYADGYVMCKIYK
jgi:hypothetical protein